jgi:hypothetical protein
VPSPAAERACATSLKKIAMDTPELVSIRTFGTRIDAELARSALEAADIESTILDDDAGGTQPQLWLRGVTLMVRAEDVARAEEILGQADSP